MATLFDFPFLLLTLSLLLLWLAAIIGAFVSRRLHPTAEEKEDLSIVIGAALTLLALIIGFSFSMATSRYDQRKNYEEAEANAIGTEYVRADLLPAADAAKVRELLKQYADQRLLFYTIKNQRELEDLAARTILVQNEMWSILQTVAGARPTPTIALAVAGMNDVLNSQGYTQAAWWNRIPVGAWILMVTLAFFCSLLIGYDAHEYRRTLFLVLPTIMAITFFLIADIDSPRYGVIRVRPQNLIALSQSLGSPQTH